MRKIKIYFILLLLLGSSAVFAQVSGSVATETNPAPGDPKRSQEEKALLLTAGENNPAKIDEASMVDPKMDPKVMPTEKDYGASNAKPAEGDNRDPKLDAVISQKTTKNAPVVALQPASATDQPAGDRNGTITNYSDISGGNDQPRGKESSNTPDYREMNGSSQQPAGDSPTK